ncbi:MAG: hypothetical protein PVSMB7_17250 [Chloroflexota bacterium]
MRNTAHDPVAKTDQRVDKQQRKAQQRELNREKELARQKAQRVDGRKRIVTRTAIGILVIGALAGAVFFALRGNAASVSQSAVAAGLGAPTSDVASPPMGSFTHVGSSLYSGSKPELLFIGAQYCPHCAGQRWAIVKALDQFGTFSNVTSSSNDDGTIPTFDLHNATFSSRYVSFVHRDVQDRSHNQLDSLSPDEQSLFSRYDTSGGIPLVLVGGYGLVGDGYDLSLIQGKSFGTVQNALQRGASSNPLVPAINAEANSLTAFICHADGMRPHSVCDRPAIRQIVAHLAA